MAESRRTAPKRTVALRMTVVTVLLVAAVAFAVVSVLAALGVLP